MFLFSILFKKTVLCLCSKNEKKLSLFCALLNIKIILFYLKLKFSSSCYCGGITFTPEMINSLPIPNIILKEEKEIINVVKNINENNKKEQLNKLNNIIYKLYGLDQSDIDIIEKYLEKK